jgi:hypothetical protein
MKLTVALSYMLYFGLAILLHPIKYNSNNELTFNPNNIKREVKKSPATAKADILHSELLFKY